jgi:hypothetical protein
MHHADENRDWTGEESFDHEMPRGATPVACAETQPRVLARVPDVYQTPPAANTRETGGRDGRILSQSLTIKILVGGGLLLLLVAVAPFLFRKPAPEGEKMPAEWADEAPKFGSVAGTETPAPHVVAPSVEVAPPPEMNFNIPNGPGFTAAASGSPATSGAPTWTPPSGPPAGVSAPVPVAQERGFEPAHSGPSYAREYQPSQPPQSTPPTLPAQSAPPAPLVSPTSPTPQTPALPAGNGMTPDPGQSPSGANGGTPSPAANPLPGEPQTQYGTCSPLRQADLRSDYRYPVRPEQSMPAAVTGPQPVAPQYGAAAPASSYSPSAAWPAGPSESYASPSVAPQPGVARFQGIIAKPRVRTSYDPARPNAY